MATALCSLNVVGSGLTKLNDYRRLIGLNQTLLKRCDLDPIKNVCRLSRNAPHNFPRREMKLTQCQRRIQADNLDEENTQENNSSKATLIWRAVKLPIYFVAFIPLTVGSAATYLEMGMFSPRRYFLLLVSSVLIITWLNLSNDVYDFDTGADKNKEESVVNLVGSLGMCIVSRTGTLVTAYTLLVLGFMGITWVSREAGNMRAILLLASAIMFGYIYQCPPFRLSYQGLGEPLCFAAFGPYATTAFYLLQGSCSGTYLPFTGSIIPASLLVGITTALILFCSHFHQVEEDRAVTKLSPLVRIGSKRGSAVVKSAIIGIYILAVAFGLSGTLPLTCLIFCGFTLPVARVVVSYVQENHNDKHKIFMAKYYCVRLHSLFGAALAAGLVVARIDPKISVPRFSFL